MRASRALIDEWVGSGGCPTTDMELRLIARVLGLADRLDERICGPIDRALAGLEPAPKAADSLAEKLRIAVAGADLGVAALAELEAQAAVSGDAHLWITAARLHAAVSLEREAAARRILSFQSLPYVFPGEIDPMMVDLLAVGDRVLPALHVDWVRKLSTWVAPALAADCAALGMWFWPVLSVLDAGKLSRPLAQVLAGCSVSGGRGLAVAYGERLGIDTMVLSADCTDLDKRIIALARLGEACQ